MHAGAAEYAQKAQGMHSDVVNVRVLRSRNALKFDLVNSMNGHVTHNATKPLSDITGLHAASSGATEDFILPFSLRAAGLPETCQHSDVETWRSYPLREIWQPQRTLALPFKSPQYFEFLPFLPTTDWSC